MSVPQEQRNNRSGLRSVGVSDDNVTPEEFRLTLQNRQVQAMIGHAKTSARRFATICMFRADGNIIEATKLIDSGKWAFDILVTKYQVNRFAVPYAIKIAKANLQARYNKGLVQ